MKNSTKVLIKKGQLEAIAKRESMGVCENSKKTREQNETRFQAQYNQFGNKGILRVGYDAETDSYYEKN